MKTMEDIKNKITYFENLIKETEQLIKEGYNLQENIRDYQQGICSLKWVLGE